jgi:glycosyltransferase involved in cell wall biosynthesis
VLVTVESLSAVEALVLGRPVVVLNMPSNLRDLVEAGVALGVPAGDDPAAALRAALEPATREALAAARARYLSDFALGVDGQATARILGLIRRTAVIGSNR